MHPRFSSIFECMYVNAAGRSAITSRPRSAFSCSSCAMSGAGDSFDMSTFSVLKHTSGTTCLIRPGSTGKAPGQDSESVAVSVANWRQQECEMTAVAPSRDLRKAVHIVPLSYVSSFVGSFGRPRMTERRSGRRRGHLGQRAIRLKLALAGASGRYIKVIFTPVVYSTKIHAAESRMTCDSKLRVAETLRSSSLQHRAFVAPSEDKEVGGRGGRRGRRVGDTRGGDSVI
ncbi:hypothetical protein PybrP1_006726 [[Pythium] brassicae (nom. inval.)]|nr:hypothetical protein PybrP1_006726 [[Pythium] brassicae (nom. inval.)]